MKCARVPFLGVTILFVLGASLAGCVSSQPLDKSVAMNIHRIVLVGPDEPLSYVAARSLPGILAVSPVGAGISAADRDDKDFDTQIRGTGLQFGQEIRTAIGDALQKEGYEVSDHVVQRPRLNFVDHYRTKNLDGDVALDAWMFVQYDTGEFDSTYMPDLWLNVRLVDIKTNKTLFQGGFTYNGAHGTSPPTLRVAPSYSFASREKLIHDPQLAAEGLRVAIPRIAEWVSQSLAKH